MKYVSVIVDNNTNATDELYTYISDFSDINIGDKVTVPFGMRNKVIDGYIAKVLDNPPDGVTKFKKILTIDPEFSLNEEQIKTAVWMRGRYICRYMEAVKCFLPASFSAKRTSKDPFADIEQIPEEEKELNPWQNKCVDSLVHDMDAGQYRASLLFGVTGSGKTEVFLQTMRHCLENNRQGIVLVPEISLTPQMVSRFVNRFGKESIAVLHSKLTQAQRSLEYKRIKNGDAKIVIGARSAIFAPFSNVGLIIIDEEHESSYKADKSPKYDTIELAVKRAIAYKAVLILGSATPSVSDYYRAKTGIFNELVLPKRYNSVPLPMVSVVDMRSEVKSGNKSLFSAQLERDIRSAAADKKQIILFLNRRGYYGYVNCRECGYTAKCTECGIALTHHKSSDALICHYCGRRRPVVKVCPKCGSRIIGGFGAGTEQLEEKTKELFPGLSVDRLDIDTTAKAGSGERIIKKFAKGKTDILIGTQLVAKGLDIANVGLVGIINADISLNIPDYRASERTFQLVCQAAGRSGRGNEQGRVVIQTYSPDDPAIKAAAEQDYLKLYKGEIDTRRLAMYPPFADIFRIIFASEDEKDAEDCAKRFAQNIKGLIDKSCVVFSPARAPVNKYGGMFRYHVIIKAPAGMRKEVSNIIINIKKEWKEKAVIVTDINPYSML